MNGYIRGQLITVFALLLLMAGVVTACGGQQSLEGTWIGPETDHIYGQSEWYLVLHQTSDGNVSGTAVDCDTEAITNFAITGTPNGQNTQLTVADTTQPNFPHFHLQATMGDAGLHVTGRIPGLVDTYNYGTTPFDAAFTQGTQATFESTCKARNLYTGS